VKLLLGLELRHFKLISLSGILGYGSVGRQVARVTRALGMDVHVCTLHPKTSLDSRRSDAYTPAGLGDPDGALPSKWFNANAAEEFQQFLENLDLLVIAIPLTEKTHGLISRREFETLSRRRTFVSNVSRGAIIVAEDLKHALDHDLIRGAAIDVTDPEPLPEESSLWKAKNLLITPHISGDSSAYVRRVFEVLKHNLIQLSEGKSLTNHVDRDEGY
jgi:phosphoglycerate dehydrogenase-like enzyme